MGDEDGKVFEVDGAGHVEVAVVAPGRCGADIKPMIGEEDKVGHIDILIWLRIAGDGEDLIGSDVHVFVTNARLVIHISLAGVIARWVAGVYAG